jgi:hypothetical protein
LSSDRSTFHLFQPLAEKEQLCRKKRDVECLYIALEHARSD